MRGLGQRSAAPIFHTWTAQRKAVSLDVVWVDGVRFRTADGATWLDLGSMTWNAYLGHAHPAMRLALARAVDQGFVPTPLAMFPDKRRAAELLAEVAPEGLERSFICLSGAEANENALRMARLMTGRHKLVTRTRSYHGATLATLWASGDPRRAGLEPGIPGVVRWEDPYSAVPCAGDLEHLLRAEDPGTVSAVLLEGVVGANGVEVPPSGYWKRIRDICDRLGVLLIVDEVLSGFGRTGRWFAIDHDGICPDLMTVAKGLTAGYAPGGAVIATRRVAEFFEEHVLQCGLTAYAHPLTCAAIVGAIGVYREERLVERAAELGAWLGAELKRFAGERSYVREVRGLGLLWAIDLRASAEQVSTVAGALRRHHLHVQRRDNLVFIAPPLVATREDLDEGLTRAGTALDEALLGS